MIRRPPGSNLFPCTTLFRSVRRPHAGHPATGLLDAGHPGRALEAGAPRLGTTGQRRSEEHTSELQSRQYLVCRLLLEKKNTNNSYIFFSMICYTNLTVISIT